MRIRDRIIYQLYRLSGTPEGEKGPGWIHIIWRLLFPIESYLLTNKRFNYLPHKQAFIINGIELSLFAIHTIGQVINGQNGEALIIEKKDGNIIWRRFNG